MLLTAYAVIWITNEVFSTRWTLLDQFFQSRVGEADTDAASRIKFLEAPAALPRRIHDRMPSARNCAASGRDSEPLEPDVKAELPSKCIGTVPSPDEEQRS